MDNVRMKVSSDEIALMTDEQLVTSIKELDEALVDARKNGSDCKVLEVEMSWFMRESQIRDVRRVANERWLRSAANAS